MRCICIHEKFRRCGAETVAGFNINRLISCRISQIKEIGPCQAGETVNLPLVDNADLCVLKLARLDIQHIAGQIDGSWIDSKSWEISQIIAWDAVISLHIQRPNVPIPDGFGSLGHGKKIIGLLALYNSSAKHNKVSVVLIVKNFGIKKG